jgi:hypothetical protein
VLILLLELLLWAALPVSNTVKTAYTQLRAVLPWCQVLLQILLVFYWSSDAPVNHF